MSLYLLLMLTSILVPVVLSFDKKLAFYKRWKEVLLSIILVALIFIIPDIFITEASVWGFNSKYHSNLVLLGLPIEEYLFFIVIPYASMFLHYSLVLYFRQFKLPAKGTRVLSIFIIAVSILTFVFVDKFYTRYACVLMMGVIIYGTYKAEGLLSKFYATYTIILLPFIIVDGILTGSLISEPIVWYNPNEIIGLRILTIPIEDFMYGFSMLLLNLLLTECFKDYFNKS
ncbi:lycopene cyclase domain-containing protein [Saccharicrinis aurantiacus]|uniref:lycopene cyclase domain-containing protein n=1 Tax=Saccharicrinis aurantiacus TaxID=1849719 RepID=UPI00249222F9|nr:lycopene cyclase domain-containing protein [Saccharicrinis aurantiacus]